MIACLVIHGYTGGPYEVDPLADYLAEVTDWHVRVPTLPGHGEQLHLEDVIYEEWIEAAENEFLKMQASYDKIYLIGFSMGGMIAAYLAGKYDVEKLVLLAPAGKFISLKYMSLHIGEALVDRLLGKIDENKFYLRYKSKKAQVPLKANLELIRLVKLARNYLQSIDIPVFIAQGRKDALVPAKTTYYLDKEIASENVEIVLFDESDHMLCLGEDKDTLNKLVLEFLKK